MDDDMNTEGAVDAVQRLTTAVGRLDGMSADEGRSVLELYRDCGQVLGLFSDLA
jgi:hypothetical protein